MALQRALLASALGKPPYLRRVVSVQSGLTDSSQSIQWPELAILAFYLTTFAPLRLALKCLLAMEFFLRKTETMDGRRPQPHYPLPPSTPGVPLPHSGSAECCLRTSNRRSRLPKSLSAALPCCHSAVFPEFALLSGPHFSMSRMESSILLSWKDHFLLLIPALLL